MAAAPTEAVIYTREQVATHNQRDNNWVVIHQAVYDLTNFQSEHPGGDKILHQVAGQDATKQFTKYHRDALLRRYARLQVGVVTTEVEKKKGLLKRLLNR